MTPAGRPSTPDPVNTEIDNVYVRFSWTKPAENGATITGYRLWILKEDGFSLQETSSCNGVTDETIVQNLECLVPMSVLTDPSLFGLPQGRVISAKL